MADKTYGLTNPQKLIWYTQEFYRGTSIENIVGTVIIPEKVDFAVLEKAINIFVEKNDSFRLRFIMNNQKIEQYVDSYSNFSVEVIDVSSENDLKKVETNIVSSVFDVFSSYLFVFKLIKFPDGHGGFIICMHHLITDAWSSGLGASEIVKIYLRLLNKENIKDISYPSYIEYIQSEKQYLESERYNKDKEFWNNLFESIPDVATIPGSKMETSKGINSKREEFCLAKEKLTKISEFCKTHKISAFNFFMAIYSLYISRISGLNNFVIGSPILNRSNSREKHTSGMFVSTVPIKIELDNIIKFKDLTSFISTRSFNTFKHQKYSYLSLLSDLRKKDKKLPNLYSILISYQNIRSTANTSEVPFNITWVPSNMTADDIDINIYDMNDSGNINIAYDYQIAKYSSQDIKNIHDRILFIIDQVLQSNDILINDIEIVTSDEKQKILNDFNNTEMIYPREKSIIQLFEEQVENVPDNIAVVFNNEKITYKKLNQQANSLAYYMSSFGVKKDDVIGICLDKNIDYIVSILSVLKLGCTFLPISTLHPSDRKEYILQNSNAALLISSNNLIEGVNFHCPYLNINTLSNNENNNYLSISGSPNDIAYILYTSGSTGKPKGVKIKNYSLVNHVFAINNRFGNTISYNDNCLSVANISFDANIQEVFIPLLFGATLHLLSDNSIYDIKYLSNYIYKNEISFTFLPPNILNDVYDLLKNKQNLKLNKMLVGVEKIKFSTLNNYLSLNENMQIHNGYGPTEATVCCISYMYNNQNKNSSNGIVPIGKPMGNNKVLIIDPNSKKLQPIGTAGEIIILGDQVSDGYVDSSLNTSFYMCDYFAQKAYCTGDFAYYDNSGNINFIGRKDNQVKINGHRIELSEIDNILKVIENISSSITLVKGNKIVAFVTSHKPLNLDKIKEILKNKIPLYMVPNKIFQLEAFPMTPNGKVDTKALLSLNFRHDSDIVIPKTKTEEKVFKMFTTLLSIENFSTLDDFFELGGDSLSAIRLSLEINNVFSKSVSVQEIFKHPCVKDLSNYIDSLNSNDRINITKVASQDSYPLSAAQKRMYITSTMSGNNSVLYNIPGGVILSKMPDIQKLENCLNKLINRHESLRTYFEVVNGNIVQKIEKNIYFKLDVSNKNIDFDNLKEEFYKFVKPFDLSIAPLFRAKLVELSDSRVALFVDFHHIISDGTSLSIFIDELCKLYNNQSLNDIKLTYKDFAVWENNALSLDQFKESQDFWVNQFSDEVPQLNLPTNYPRPSENSYKGSKIYSFIDNKKIIEISEELEITPYMLLLAAYYILLKKYTMQDDIIVGSPIVGRDNLDTYNILGMFVNTLALRTSVDSKKTFKEFAENIKTLCLDSFKHQTYPFDELISKIDIVKSSSRNPLFDTMFIYQNNKLEKIKFGDIDTEYYTQDVGIAKFDLSLEITPEENNFKLCFEYSTDLFEKSFIENMSNHYINILNNILSNIDIKIANINMLSSDEENMLLNTFNNTSIDFNINKSISQTFESIANMYPDKIAVVFNNQNLSYQELNEKANSLAHYINKMGIDKNDVVGIMCNRSLEMVIAIMAVLKSGGTYILIDNSLPANRVKYMLSNSLAKLLIKDKNYEIDFENQFDITEFDYSKNTSNLKIIKELSDSFAIIYTSGSTGNPKGVLLKEIGLLNLVHAFKKVMEIDKTSSHLGLSAVSFDMFAVELFTSVLLRTNIIPFK